MNRLTQPVLLLILTIFYIVPLSAQTSVDFMTFNVRDETLDPDPPFSWNARKQDCYKVINESGADIIGLQECTWVQMQDLFANCPKYKQAGNGTHAIILYDDAKWEAIETGAFWLSPTPDVPHSVATEWGAIYERVTVYALLRNKTTGFSIYAYNTHYSHVSDNARNESSKVMAQQIANRDITQFPFVMMGDLNSGADKWSIQYLIDENLGSPIHMSQTWNAYSNTWENGSTYNNHEGWIAGYGIDHILVEESVGTTTYATIDRSKFNDQAYPSDHYPVKATVEFPDQNMAILKGSHASLQFLMNTGDPNTTESQIVQIDNIGSASSGAITSTTDLNWVDIEALTDGQFEISINDAATTLIEGDYSGTITFSGEEAENVVTIAVHLTVFSGCLYMENYDVAIDQDHYTTYNGFTQQVEEKFTFSTSDGMMTLSSAGHDEWDYTAMDFHHEGQPAIFDFKNTSDQAILTIRVRADAGGLLRASLKDINNIEADNGNIDYWIELTPEFQTYQIDFTDQLFNQHVNGMDDSQINGLIFRLNSGFASQWAYVGELDTYDYSFVGNIEIDYIRLSACPQGVTTGNAELLETRNDTFYPNPFSSELTLNPKFNGGFVRVLNVVGKEVFSTQFSGNTLQLPASLPTGIYWLDYDDRKGNSRVQKVVKQ